MMLEWGDITPDAISIVSDSSAAFEFGRDGLNISAPFPLTGFSLDSSEDYLQVTSSGEVVARIMASWDAITASLEGQIEIQWKPSSETEWSSVFVQKETTSHVFGPVISGVNYDVRIRTVTIFGRPGTWNTITEHSVVGKTTPPEDISSVSATLERGGIRLSWPAVSNKDIGYYEIRQGTEWSSADLIDKTNALTHLAEIDGAGAYNYLVKSVDTSGNESVSATAGSLTINAPDVPTVDTIDSGNDLLKVSASGEIIARIKITWTNATASFLRQTEIQWKESDDSEWEAALIDSDTTIFFIGPVKSGVEHDIRIRSITEHGILGSWQTVLRYFVIGKTAPPSNVTSFQAVAASDRVELSWTPVPEKDLSHYTIKAGSTWGTATEIAQIKGTAYQTKEPGNGPWLIKAVDTSGNESENAVSASIFPDLPVSSNLSVQIVTNNVLLRWSTSRGTFLLYTHEIRKGADFSTAEVIGTSDTTFSNLFENSGGEYTYWVVPVDAAGNYGTETGITVSVDDPPDFVFNNDFHADWSGGTNIQPLLAGSASIIPFHSSESVQDREIVHGYTSPQDQINAGYDYVAQPVPISASYDAEYDAGAVIASTQINVTLDKSELHGNVDYTVTISIKKESSDSWSAFTAGFNSVFATNFRYVRVQIDFGSSSGHDFIKANNVYTVLKSKIRNYSGVVDVTGNPTTANFNVDFIDVQGITLTAKGADSRVATYDFTDEPYPDSFDIYLFDSNGNPVTGEVRWSARGY